MQLLTSLTVEGNIKHPKLLLGNNEYWGTVTLGEKIRINAVADGRVLINGQDTTEFTPSVGLNVYLLTVEGKQGEFRLNVICRLPEQEAFSQWLRPQLHFSPELFSLNDPNGLVYDAYTGEYHLFFQCDYPGPGYKVQGDTKAWGHAVSKDMISWKELPVAIPSDETGAIWSGSAVIDKDNLSGLFDSSVPPQSRFLFYYTYFRGKKGLGCSVGLAYSVDHCRTLINYGTIIENENNVYSAGFRDPNITWVPNPELADGGKWVMVACGDTAALVFWSNDLIHWEYSSEVLDKNGNRLITECPNIFPMEHEGKTVWVLMAAGTWYVLGDFIFENGIPYYKPYTDLIYPCNGVKELWGPGSSPLFPENYASQTFYNTKGDRRIQMSWIRDFWYDPVTKPWWSFLSLPVQLRPVSTKDGMRIGYYPIDEWKGLIKEELLSFNGEISQDDETACRISQIKDELLLIRARLKGEGEFGFSVLGGGVKVYYDAKGKHMITDKSGSGGDYATFKYDGPVLTWDDYADITVIVDRCSVEAYINGTYQGGMAYAQGGISFISDCVASGSIEIYSLNKIQRNTIESFY